MNWLFKGYQFRRDYRAIKQHRVAQRVGRRTMWWLIRQALK